VKFVRTTALHSWEAWDGARWIIALLLLIFVTFQVNNQGDFRVFIEAASLLRNGQNPYHVWLLHHNCLYLYSPFFALTLIPFSYCPGIIINIVWLSANVFFSVRSYRLMQHYLPPVFPKRAQNELLFLIPLLCTIRFWLYNIELLQMTIFMLWCILESLRLFREERWWTGGFLLALGINIKLLPIVLLPYLLMRMRWKAFLPVLVFSVFFLAVPALFLGFHFNLQLLHNWMTEINPASGGQYAVEADYGPHSLNALVPSLLMKTPGDDPMIRNLVDWPAGSVLILLNAVIGILIFCTLFFTGFVPRKESSKLQTARELSYIILLIPLIFPHQQKYAFFLAAPALMYLSWYLIRVYNMNFTSAGKGRWVLITVLIIVAFALMILTTDGLIGWRLNKLSQHFKLITYGALLLLLALALSPEKHLEGKT
jgi:hypothetical protein